MAPVYSNELRFPERAEFLDDYGSNYSVHLEHWSAVGERFAPLLRKVHTNTTSRLLMICGEPGSGKSLFCQRLEADHGRTKQALKDDRWQLDLTSNLWEILSVNDRTRAEEILRETTRDTIVHRVAATGNWLAELLTWGKQDDHKVRVVIFDNFDHVPYLAGLAGVALADYVALRNDQREEGAFSTIAQNLVQYTRGDLRNVIVVCTGNNTALMKQLHAWIERVWPEMPQLLEVPPLDSKIKERIARTNLNRLNAVSYWYTLDRAAPEELEKVHTALTGTTGIGRVYERVDQAGGTSRPGPRGRPHWFTVVTLGAATAEVKSRIEEDWEKSAPETRCFNTSFAVWRFHQGFARSLRAGAEARRCRLFDSEFEVCWVALSMDTTRALIDGVASPSDLGQHVFRLVRDAHADLDENALEGIDIQLKALAPDDDWAQRFRDPGRTRSLVYEPVLATRAGFEKQRYSVGLPSYSTIKPDVTAADCTPCALTDARGAADLRRAIARSGHVVEFTAFLRGGLEGITPYLLGKVINYAKMLEDV